MHNEMIWIVKDGQRVQVSAWVHGHYDKLLKLLHQFLTVMSNAVIVDLACSTNGHQSEAKHESKAEDFTTKKKILTRNLHNCM